MFKHYVYIYLNPLKRGNYKFNKFSFDFEVFYVGKGKNKRYIAHLSYYDKHNKLKQNVLNKIKNENLKPIIIKLYENITEYTAFRLEKYLINLIGRRDINLGSLCNLTNGGEGSSGTIYNRKRRINMISEKRKIIQYNNEGHILNIWSSITDLSIAHPLFLTNHIHRACKSNGNRMYNNYLWKYYDNENLNDTININDGHKKIIQYDLNGTYIKEWNSARDIYKLGFSCGAILKCCRNNRKKLFYYKFKNYMWFFKENECSNKITSYNKNKAFGKSVINKKNIMKYDIDNNLLGIFTSSELKNEGFNTKTIYGCCRKKYKISQGYKWKWSE